MKTQSRVKNTPPTVGWILAIVTLLGALASVAVGVTHSIKRGSREIYELVTGALENQDFRLARQILNEASEPTPMDRWLYSERETITRTICSSAARDLILLLEQSRNSKSVALAAIFTRIERSVSSISEEIPRAVEMFEVFEPAFKQQLAVLSKQESIDGEILSLDAELSAAAEAFELARHRFARLLGLPLREDSDTSPTPPQAYQGGVLKDLPTITALPDNLSDLLVVKDHLVALGAQVSSVGPNAAEEFKAEMMSIQAVTRKALDDYSRRARERQNLVNNKQDLAENSRSRFNRSLAIGKEFILSLVGVNWPK